MADAYSTRFLAGGGILEQTYVVPAGRVAVVREIDFVNGAQSASTLRAAIDGYADFALVDTPPVASKQWLGRVVLNAGETLKVYSQSESSWSAVVSGYLLQTA